VSSRLRAIARDTLAIIDRGFYDGAAGPVAIGTAVARAVGATRLYLPDDPLPAPAATDGPPAVEVTNESSLSATRRLAATGDVACLVFASARNPGGGFTNGAQAQEESLARGSALYPCLTACPEFYAWHRAHAELTYSDRVIYSPHVPVFRDDDGRVLPTTYPVSFLTAAAPNLGAIQRSQKELEAEVPGVLRRRAGRVLDIAAAHGHRRLVLGAWGCGVFGNDPGTVARAFAEQLGTARGFTRVVFAVLDRQRFVPTYTVFRRLTTGA